MYGKLSISFLNNWIPDKCDKINVQIISYYVKLYFIFPDTSDIDKSAVYQLLSLLGDAGSTEEMEEKNELLESESQDHME